MPKLSVIITTRDEEANIRACIDSVGWADEIIVVDDDSRDRTREIAAGYPNVRVVRRAMAQGFGRQKQFALQQASGEWVLSLDADERVSEELRQEIIAAISRSRCAGFRLRRRNFVLDRFLLDRGVRNIRLFKRSSAFFSPVRVHESVVLNGRCGAMRSPLLHFANSSRTIEGMTRAANTYSTLSAQDLFERGRRLTPVTMPLYACAYPLYLFFWQYILEGRFLDGRAGFAVSFFRALEGFLISVKLWELQRRRR